jgi:hypothetical protein
MVSYCDGHAKFVEARRTVPPNPNQWTIDNTD